LPDNAEQKWGVRSRRLLEATLRGLAADPLQAESSRIASRGSLDVATADRLSQILSASHSYRDGALIQIAYALSAEGSEDGADLRHRQEGGRNVAKSLGALLAELHVPGIKDAFQNIGKNSTNLVRGNVEAFDELLGWMNVASVDQLRIVFDFLASTTALMARPVLPFPALDTSSLTFARMVQIINGLLAKASGGAYEQFLLAAFVHGLIDEYSMAGREGVHVETKNINASDASSRSASDVQIKRGNRFEEAFEVTANHWSAKPLDAVALMKAHDLARIHVAAKVDGGALSDVSALLTLPSNADVSVLDLRALLHGLSAFMRKPARAVALRRLYELLDRHQHDIERTNGYVRLLDEIGVSI
jgi:hypothetical protein